MHVDDKSDDGVGSTSKVKMMAFRPREAQSLENSEFPPSIGSGRRRKGFSLHMFIRTVVGLQARAFCFLFG